MDYEYKSIILVPDGKWINKDHNKNLNDHFKKGWEYIECISQNVSTASEYEVHGAIIVIFKRKKDSIKL